MGKREVEGGNSYKASMTESEERQQGGEVRDEGNSEEGIVVIGRGIAIAGIAVAKIRIVVVEKAM